MDQWAMGYLRFKGRWQTQMFMRKYQVRRWWVK